MATEIKVGDWVRFYSGGVLAIGVVEYRQPRTAVCDLICTNIGSVPEDSILEVRNAVQESGPEEAVYVLSPEAQAYHLKRFGHINVQDLEMSVRTTNVLWDAGLHTVSNIMENPKRHYRRMKGLGSKSVNEIVDALWYRFRLRLPECKE